MIMKPVRRRRLVLGGATAPLLNDGVAPLQSLRRR